MKIVIDIDEESYEHIKGYKNEDVLPMGWYAISHGKPLIMSNCISREAAIDLLKNIDTIVSPFSDDVLLIDKAEAMAKLTFLPPEQPESDNPDINVESKWYKIYSWLNDMYLGISPDESTPDDERERRISQTDIIVNIMGWIEANVFESKSD